MKKLLPAVVLATFGVFSLWVTATRGYFGFLHLAAGDRWGLQIFLDLCIAIAVANLWLVRDARERGIRAWPYVLGTLPFGSLSILVYMVRRR
jgi:hypothetical protein